ncbi:ribonuclease inhibitor [Bailinhaonella thermotolerans]|uniref:ribonuclease inhibitor n=1 Tax=Bailinhaonella thermotolerans TaxID=1070861 RepID=UPI001F5BB0B5|nr:ribonuclease inhibitor [Bailinhaonella thermotolerans]
MNDLDDLLAWLRSGRPVPRRVDFRTGTAMPDGRLDLCKQSLGPYGAALVAGALPPYGPVRHLLMGTDGLGDDGAATAAAGAVASGAETLYLGCNEITAGGACRIADRLLASPGVVRGLWLKRNPLGPAGARIGADLVPAGLTTLDLVQTGLTAGGLSALVDGVLAAGGIGRLFVSGNPLGPAGAAGLARLVAADGVDELYASANGLGDDGALLIASALRPGGRLRRLSLASDGMGPAGVLALIRAAVASGVEVLDLGRVRAAAVLAAPDNRLDDATAAEAADALAAHPHRLAHLDLTHTATTSRAALHLLGGLRRAPSPTRVRLGRGIAFRVKRDLAEAAAAVPPLTPHPEVAAVKSVHRTGR